MINRKMRENERKIDMKTVQEMIEMANQYQSTAAGLTRTNNKKLPFQMIIDNLNPEENVILAFGASGDKKRKTPYQMVAIA